MSSATSSWVYTAIVGCQAPLPLNKYFNFLSKHLKLTKKVCIFCNYKYLHFIPVFRLQNNHSEFTTHKNSNSNFV